MTYIAPPRLTTRIAGQRVAIWAQPTGVGDTLWAGEFRDSSGQPLATGHVLGVWLAPYTARGFGQLLAKLVYQERLESDVATVTA